MKRVLFVLLTALGSWVYADTPDVSIPEKYIAGIKTTDFVEVSGTNDMGGPESFTIHNEKAISEFVKFLTSDRYTAVAKNLKPDFKSMSVYDVRLSARGGPVLEFRMIADSILDISGEPLFYMESDRHSDNLMAPLMRLR